MSTAGLSRGSFVSSSRSFSLRCAFHSRRCICAFRKMFSLLQAAEFSKARHTTAHSSFLCKLFLLYSSDLQTRKLLKLEERDNRNSISLLGAIFTFLYLIQFSRFSRVNLRINKNLILQCLNFYFNFI